MTVFAVDAHLLWQVVWVSLLAGVGITTTFSFVILGATRAGDARRAGRGGAAAAYAAFAAFALVLVGIGIVLGVQAMINK